MPGLKQLLEIEAGVAFAGAVALILYSFWAAHRMKPLLAACEPTLHRTAMRAMTPENAILAVALDRKRREVLHPDVQAAMRKLVLLHRLTQLCMLLFGVGLIGSMTVAA
jgi:hypothetical protein